jgi:hypothetical protein
MSRRSEQGIGHRSNGRARPNTILAAMGAGALLGALVLAGCSGANQDSGSQSMGAGVAPTPAPPVGAPNAGGSGTAAGSASTQDTSAAKKTPELGVSPTVVLNDRSIVRIATLSVRVPDVLAASSRASALAAAEGGFVAGEQTQAQPDHPAKAEAVLTLRVPANRLPALLPQLRGLGTLLTEEQGADDVTGQVVDVQARINAQRASVARVSALMSRASTLGQVVQIEGELTRRQADLESLLGQAAKLADQTTLATVTATLVGPTAPVAAAAAPPSGFGAGLSKGWHAFAVSGTWLLMAVGAALPFLLLLTPLALLAVVMTRRRSRAVGPVADPPPPAAA